jgi:hypothetical protein
MLNIHLQYSLDYQPNITAYQTPVFKDFNKRDQFLYTISSLHLKKSPYEMNPDYDILQKFKEDNDYQHDSYVFHTAPTYRKYMATDKE